MPARANPSPGRPTFRASKHCSRHPSSPAAWECIGCGELLCPDCAAAGVVGNTHYVGCSLCGGATRELMVPGALHSFPRRLAGALSLPVGPFTLGSGVAIWALFWAFRHAEGWARAGWVFAAIAPLFWATFFSTLRASAHGGAEVPAEAMQHVVKPAGGAWAATALVTAAWSASGIRAPCMTVLVCATAPSLLLGLAVESSLASAFSPAGIWQRVRALGADYALAAGVFVLVGLLAHAWGLSAAFARQNELGPLGPFFDALMLYALLVLGRVLGLLLASRGDAIGYPLPPGELIPALPGATPRGALPPKSEPPPRKRPEFIELDE